MFTCRLPLLPFTLCFNTITTSVAQALAALSNSHTCCLTLINIFGANSSPFLNFSGTILSITGVSLPYLLFYCQINLCFCLYFTNLNPPSSSSWMIYCYLASLVSVNVPFTYKYFLTHFFFLPLILFLICFMLHFILFWNSKLNCLPFFTNTFCILEVHFLLSLS